MFEEKIKHTAWKLALAGLIPFYWALAEYLMRSSLLGINPAMMFFTYSAVILSFLGGMYWMRAVTLTGVSRLSMALLCISVIPSLIGWAALMMGGGNGVALMAAGFLGLLGAEYHLLKIVSVPEWFWTLRWRITALVVFAHLCLWWSL